MLNSTMAVAMDVSEYFAIDSMGIRPFVFTKAPIAEDIAESGLWRQPVIEFGHQALTFSNTPDGDITYRAPFTARYLNRIAYDIASRIIYLNDFCNCFREVSWALTTRPPFHALQVVRSLMYALFTNPDIERMDLFITDCPTQYYLTRALRVAISHLKLRKLNFSILDGDISGHGLGYKILKLFTPLQNQASQITLFIDISRLTHVGARALKQNSALIKELTVKYLADKRTLDLLLDYIRHTAQDFSLTIVTLALSHRVKMRLARGNLSLTILSAPSADRIDFSCEQELAVFTVGKTAALKMAGFDMAIREMTITGGPSDNEIKQIMARFNKVCRLAR
ncbi:hypothetical protein TRVA0_014S00298 [Trichomonascus vanleenenianus]|uniref:uncharacterized protein n=1 Tax=Trichomonascus vanleenenianus TaxID=2268995 RepID=UPI003EC9A721